MSIQRQLTLTFAIFIVGLPALADTRSDKIQALMTAQGLMATWDEQLGAVRANGRQQTQAMFAQVMRELNPPDEFRVRLQAAADEYAIAIDPPWSGKEMVEAWSRHYGQAFTEEELDQLLMFYSSPLGQKEIMTSRRAMTQLGDQLIARQKVIGERALAAFLKRVQAIAADCNCKR